MSSSHTKKDVRMSGLHSLLNLLRIPSAVWPTGHVQLQQNLSTLGYRPGHWHRFSEERTIKDIERQEGRCWDYLKDRDRRSQRLFRQVGPKVSHISYGLRPRNPGFWFLRGRLESLYTENCSRMCQSLNDVTALSKVAPEVRGRVKNTHKGGFSSKAAGW